jgi:cell wall-associated NlpC family hydrolase
MARRLPRTRRLGFTNWPSAAAHAAAEAVGAKHSGSVAEHQGRVPQPGVPAGPRNKGTVLPSGRIEPYVPPSAAAPRRPSPTSRSVPLSPLLATLPELNDLLTPGPTARENAEAAHTLGVRPKDIGIKAAEPSEGSGGGLVHDVVAAVQALTSGGAKSAKLPAQPAPASSFHPTGPTPAIRKREVEDARIFAREQGEPAPRARSTGAAATNPGTAVMSSNPQRPAHAPVNPRDPLGAKTLGRVSTADLVAAGRAGTLHISPSGTITVPKTRQAARGLRSAQRRVSNSGADLQALHRRFPELNLRTLRAYKAAQRVTGVPPQLLAGIEGQESGYGSSTLPGVRSGSNEAGAAGPFQIGIGTGAAGDWWHEHMPPGASPYNDRTAAIAAGKYLTEAGATKDPSTWYNAAFSYNHADWYAQKAVELAREHAPLAQLANPQDPQARASLEQAKADARAVGINPNAVLGQSAHPSLGPVEPQVMSRIQAGLKAAQVLASANVPYVWGGGHQPFAKGIPGGLDCSGAVSYVLHAMGVLSSPLTSGEMGQILQAGPGAVTVFYNAQHTFMRIGKKFFGTSVNDSSKGLAFYPAPSSAYLAQYNVGHVPGLGKKVALQLGVKPAELAGGSTASSEAIPGVSLSANGTTATVNPGAAAVHKRAVFTNAPLAAISTPYAAGAALPEGFQRFQLGGAPEAPSGGFGVEGEISRLLRKRRL